MGTTARRFANEYDALEEKLWNVSAPIARTINALNPCEDPPEESALGEDAEAAKRLLTKDFSEKTMQLDVNSIL